jgi:ATP-dependent DNA ligase
VAGLIVRFIEPMECLPVSKIPEGDQRTYELKLDGYQRQTVHEMSLKQSS